MANSCSIIPPVEYTPTGASMSVIEESKLFWDLRSKFPNNRKKQVFMWNLANNPKFKEYAMSNYPEYFTSGKGFTSQGEINLPTLLKLTGEDKILEEKGFMKKLMDTTGENKEFDATSFEMTEEGYAEGINQVARFNQRSDYRSKYKAQLIVEDGKYQIRLVNWKAMKRDDKTRFIEKSVKDVRRNEVRYKIIRLMAHSGMHVVYVDDNNKELISETNPLSDDMSAVEQGYRAYVGIMQGSSDDHFLIKAGSFTLLSIGENNDNVKRLYQIISNNEDFIKNILSEIKDKDPDLFAVVNSKTGDDYIKARNHLIMSYIIGNSLKNHEAMMNRFPIVGSFWRIVKTVCRNMEILWNRLKKNIDKEEESLKKYTDREKELRKENILNSRLAEKIAKSFYNGEYGNYLENLNSSIERTALVETTSYVQKATASRRLLKNMLKDLKSKYTGWKDFMMLDDQLSKMAEMNELTSSIFGEQEKINMLMRISEIIELITDDKSGLCGKQLIYDIKTTRKYGEAMQIYSEKINAARHVTKTLLEMINEMNIEKDILGPNVNPDLANLYTAITNNLSNLIGEISSAGDIITYRFLGDVIGSDQIMVTLGKKWWKDQKLSDLGINIDPNDKESFKDGVRMIGKNKVLIPIRLLIEKSEDISSISRYIISMGRVEDTTLQMIDIYNRKRQGEVRDNVMEVERKMSAIYKYAKEHGVDINEFFEREHDGDEEGERFKDKKSSHNRMTGNFIMPVCYSKYDREKDIFKKRVWNEYKEELNSLSTEDNTQWSLNDKYHWEKYWNEVFKAWNSGRLDGIARAEEGKIPFPDGSYRKAYIPCGKDNKNFSKSAVRYNDYTNHRYYELFGTEGSRSTQQKHNYKVYNDLLEIKKGLDSRCLERNSTQFYRAPQFKAGTLNEIQNKGTFVGTITSIAKSPIHDFLEDADRYQFGDDRYNESVTSDFDPFRTESHVQRHVADRIPLYGINKLKNMEELSTNLWRTMRAYAFMAENYKATRDNINTLELYHDIITNVSSRDNRVVCPNKIAKLDKYFNDNFYGMGSRLDFDADRTAAEFVNRNLKKIDNNLGTNLTEHFAVRPATGLVSSVVKSLNNITAFLFLGFNLTSQGINFISGNLRLATESIKGEKFDYWELKLAVVLWLTHKMNNLLWKSKVMVVDSVKNKSITRPRYMTNPDKLELFMQKCDTTNEYQKNVSKIRHSSATNIIRDVSMFGYSLGDDFMSSIGYIAQALHTKLIDKDGNTKGKNGVKYNVWNALKIVDDENGEPMLKFDPDNIFFTSKRHMRRYKCANLLEARILGIIDEQEAPNNDARMAKVNVKALVREMNDNIQQIENDLKNYPVQENIDRLNDLKALYLYLANEKAFSMEKVGGAYINVDGNISLKNMLSGLKRYKEEQKYGDRDFAELEYNGRMNNLYMHGVYNQTDRAGFQKSLIGSMISTMKGYAFGYFMREYMGSRIDIGNGKRLTIEEYMEKYFPEVLKDPNFGTDAKLVTQIYTGDIRQINELIDIESFQRDVFNVMILDTDQIEGTLLTSLKALTSPKLWPVILEASITSVAGLVPPIGNKIRNKYMKEWGSYSDLNQEQKANILREVAKNMFILFLGILRTLVGTQVPPEDESDEEWDKRLDNMIESIAAHYKDGKLTNEEEKMLKVLMEVPTNGSESQYKAALRDALRTYMPQYEAKPSLWGLLYFCLAGSEIENMGTSIMYPRMMISELRNVTNMSPAMFSMMLQMYNYISVAHDSRQGERLMCQVNDEIESYKAGNRTFEFIKKKPNDHQIAAALMLQNYYESHKNEKHIVLPDINSEDFMNVTVGGVNISSLPDTDKNKIRTACYNYMKEIWGKDKNFFMKGNDGRFILNSESGVYSKTANFMNVAKTGGAGIVAGNNDELKEQILENELDDPLRNSESKYLINRFYYGSSGYGHKRYDLKYLKNDWKSLTIFRSLKPMSEPKTGIKNRLYFYTGRR